MKKEFSLEFQRDIAELLDLCVENHSDSITIKMSYEKYDLDMDVTFRVHLHDGEEIE